MSWADNWRGLAKHLAETAATRGADSERRPSVQGSPILLSFVSEGILANPQAHIDALVEAGVLARGFEPKTYMGGTPPPDGIVPFDTVISYRVVQPHVHEWRLTHELPLMSGFFAVVCDCGAWHKVPNRLPIEVPE